MWKEHKEFLKNILGGTFLVLVLSLFYGGIADVQICAFVICVVNVICTCYALSKLKGKDYKK